MSSIDKRDWIGCCFFCGKKIEGEIYEAPSGNTAHKTCIIVAIGEENDLWPWRLKQ